MRSGWMRMVLAVVCVLGGLESAAMAQFGEPFTNGVMGVGVGKVTVKPTHARLVLTMKATSEDMKEATQKLRDMKTKAIDTLKQLKAIEDSIKVVKTGNGPAGGAENAYMMRMMRRQAAEQGIEMPSNVSLHATLEADWALPAGDDELLLMFADRLTAKIEELKLAGGDDAEASEEQQEMMEQMGMYGGGEETSPVSIFFWAKPSAEQLATARAEAVKEAREQAAALAEAAGITMGPLKMLSENSMESMAGYYSSVYTGNAAPQPREGELLASNPGELTKTLQVAVAFAIGER